MSTQSILNDRNYSIDLIKIIAMCMVVCLHTTHHFLDLNRINLEYILYYTSAIAIPLFFMVSGYLLIGRKSITYTYAIRKIWGIIRFILIIIGLWWFLRGFIKGWNLEILIDSFCGAFLQKGDFWMFWYFCSMCILYSLYPLINKLYAHPHYYILSLILLGITQNLIFSCNLITEGETLIAQPFRIWNWLFYFVLGGMLKFRMTNKALLLSLILLLLIANIYMIHFFSPFMNTSYCEYFYGYPIVIILSSSVFLFVRDLNFQNVGFLKSLSKLFLPVYTIHPFIIRCINPSKFINYGGAAYFLTILLTTIIISWLLMKIPIIKQLFKI